METAFQEVVDCLYALRELADEVVVIKIGGNVLPHHEAFCEDIESLVHASVLPVIVHGGGKAVTDWEQTLGREATFVEGLRVTDADALELVQMVLAGKVNSDLVAMLNARTIRAIGLTGADGELLLAKPRKKPTGLGFVGEVERVNISTFVALGEGGFVPVIAPLGMTETGQLLNINADTVAGDIARALQARHFLLLTDVPGVQDKEGTVLPELTAAKARQLIRNGTISGGMIPKVTACLDALAGVPRAHIVDGREPHAILRQLLTLEPVGTEFSAKGQ
ncbi:MAG: acetylglutamate kinase [Chloroflexota bacterium]|nr:acetylglutamate kinase [Chloroflexota bacterium]